MEQRAVVVGAGWLGGYLAEQLKCRNWQVEATSRTTHCDRVLFNANSHTSDISLNKAIWFFCIPSGRTEVNQLSYKQHLDFALQQAKQLTARRFILCSSIGTYPQTKGIYHEGSLFNAETEKQQRLLDSENSVLDSGLNATVVRLGGLIDARRHPGRFLAGKQLKSNGLASVNLIHLYDAAEGLIYLSNLDASYPIVNLVTPDHPTKQDFYLKATAALGLEAPSFSNSKHELREVSSQLIRNLGYQYKFNTLDEALVACGTNA